MEKYISMVTFLKYSGVDLFQRNHLIMRPRVARVARVAKSARRAQAAR